MPQLLLQQTAFAKCQQAAKPLQPDRTSLLMHTPTPVNRWQCAVHKQHC
jgi:hypothetical protein